MTELAPGELNVVPGAPRADGLRWIPGGNFAMGSEHFL
jgi:hypothetical protein